MNQSDFEALVWTQWAKTPDGKVQPEEIRPMREVQNTGGRGSGFKDAPWKFRAWAVPYPDEDDPWMLHPMNRDLRVIQSVVGIDMFLDNEELFKLKELMLEIKEKFIEKIKDEDGKVIKTNLQEGYRSALPFLSVFNKSVYDVIQKEHMRLQSDVGESKYTKAILRFDTWFKANGFIEPHGGEIEPFWANAFGGVELSEPESDPPPLSDKDDWRDVLLEVELPSNARFQLRVIHPSLDKQKGVVVNIDNWQTKVKDILTMKAWGLGYRLDKKQLVEQYGVRFHIKKINRTNIYVLNKKLKEAVGITNQNPILPVEDIQDGQGTHPVLPSIRLSKKLVYTLENIDLIFAQEYASGTITSDTELTPEVRDSLDYATTYYSIQPEWMSTR